MFHFIPFVHGVFSKNKGKSSRSTLVSGQKSFFEQISKMQPTCQKGGNTHITLTHYIDPFKFTGANNVIV